MRGGKAGKSREGVAPLLSPHARRLLEEAGELFSKKPLPRFLGVRTALLSFFLAAMIGFWLSYPHLVEHYSRHPEDAFRNPFPYRFDTRECLRAVTGTFINNSAVFALLFLAGLMRPRLALLGLALLALKTGLMAPPYDDFALGVLRYALVVVAVGLGEFSAYGLALERTPTAWGVGAALLLTWAYLENRLIGLCG